MYVSLNSSGLPQQPVKSANAAGQLASMLNDKAQSPLEAAQKALSRAKAALEEQRDERMEQALGGYKFLRSRQTSYEDQLAVQQGFLEEFEGLSDGGDVSALVERANRYANSQRQYADYLEQTGQGGYAAFQYQDRAELTVENFAAETADFVSSLEEGAGQWRERVSSYCGQLGLTPNDFERYIQERKELSSAYFQARQRVAELLYASDAAGGNSAGQSGAEECGAAPVKRSFDTVELSNSALAADKRYEIEDRR